MRHLSARNQLIRYSFCALFGLLTSYTASAETDQQNQIPEVEFLLNDVERFREQVLALERSWPIDPSSVEFLSLNRAMSKYLRIYERYLDQLPPPQSASHKNERLDQARLLLARAAHFTPQLNALEQRLPKDSADQQTFSTALTQLRNQINNASKLPRLKETDGPESELRSEDYLRVLAQAFFLTLDEAALALKSKNLPEVNIKLTEANYLLASAYLAVGKAREDSADRAAASLIVAMIGALVSQTDPIGGQFVGDTVFYLSSLLLFFNAKYAVGISNEDLKLPHWIPEEIGYQILPLQIRSSQMIRQENDLLTLFWEGVRKAQRQATDLNSVEIDSYPGRDILERGPNWLLDVYSSFQQQFPQDQCRDLFFNIHED